MDLFDEARIEALDARYRRAAFALPTEQDDACATEQLTRQSARDTRNVVEPFFLGHRSDDATDDGAGGPAALASPVAWSFDSGYRNAGVDKLDAIRRHPGLHHRRLHCIRD